MITCTPVRTIYVNQETGYTVAEYQTKETLPDTLVELDQTMQRFKASGMDLPTMEGLELQLAGNWKETKYGLQLLVKSYHIQSETSNIGIEQYLSELIEGIGPVIAKKIVAQFHGQTLEVLEHDPERLLEIPGITGSKLRNIKKSYKESADIRELMVYLAPLGATVRMVRMIEQHFKHKALHIVKSDPYRLCEIRGFGFLKVDPIAAKSSGFTLDDPKRIPAAMQIQAIYQKEWLAREKAVDEIQVLSPLRTDTKASAEALNDCLHEIVNPKSTDKRELPHGGKVYRVGDKVMQLQNDKAVSNGDIGFVREIYHIGSSDKIEVDFGDNRSRTYTSGESWPLTHAYAITVHKAQGLEYRVVIVPMLKCFRRMLRRNLLYTAVTRATDQVIIVGSWAAICQAIRTNVTNKRNTMFGYWVRTEFERLCGIKAAV